MVRHFKKTDHVVNNVGVLLPNFLMIGALLYPTLNWFLYRTDTISMMRLISGKST